MGNAFTLISFNYFYRTVNYQIIIRDEIANFSSMRWLWGWGLLGMGSLCSLRYKALKMLAPNRLAQPRTHTGNITFPPSK